MTPARDVIAHAIVYDHNPTRGADAILAALDAAGYAIVRKGSESRAPETTRLYANLGDVSASRRAR